MLDWRHYAFRERLVYRAKGHPNCQVLIQDEHKTSKTCSNCDAYDAKLGGAEIYDCNNCGKKMNRDVNGAKNILRKFLGLMA